MFQLISSTLSGLWVLICILFQNESGCSEILSRRPGRSPRSVARLCHEQEGRYGKRQRQTHSSSPRRSLEQRKPRGGQRALRVGLRRASSPPPRLDPSPEREAGGDGHSGGGPGVPTVRPATRR